MKIRSHLCWLLGHEKEDRVWPYSTGSTELLVPYCKHCDKCLTILPLEMLVREAWYKEYEHFPTEYSSLYKDQNAND